MPLRLRTIRLTVVLLSVVLAAGAAFSASALGAPTPLAIAVGHTNTIVRPTLDPSRAATKTIGSAGGTLTTIAADGTTFTLTLPRNALTGDEQVTMTPLLSLSGGGVQLLAGVQIAPDGLRLLEPAMLDIAPAKTAPANQQVAFGYKDNGSQFGLVPLALQSSVEIPLIGLGGAGLARANSGQLAGLEAHPPSDVESAFLAQLAAPLYQLRRHRSTSAARQEVLGTLSGYYDGFVKTTLGAPGSSLTAWARATTRSAGWEEEVQVLGYARRFAKDEKLVKAKVFEKALRKRWNIVTRTCRGGGAKVGNLQKALQLGRVAQIRRTGSLLGGSAQITAGIAGCAEIAAQATLGNTSSNWQSGLAVNQLTQIAAIVATGPAALVLQARTGDNEFAFLSAHIPISERMTSWTLSPMYSQCAKPTFVGFTADPNQLYAEFYATLAVAPDLFVGSKAPATRVTLQVFGADLANWSTTCPQPDAFSQSPGAVAGLTAVTTTSPINLSSSKPAVKFQGSANILSGGAISGFANENGSVAVRFPK